MPEAPEQLDNDEPVADEVTIDESDANLRKDLHIIATAMPNIILELHTQTVLLSKIELQLGAINSQFEFNNSHIEELFAMRVEDMEMRRSEHKNALERDAEFIELRQKEYEMNHEMFELSKKEMRMIHLGMSSSNKSDSDEDIPDEPKPDQ
jgi:hypothetical protein